MSRHYKKYIINYWPQVPEAFDNEEWKREREGESFYNMFQKPFPRVNGCRRVRALEIVPYRSKEWIKNEKYNDYQPPTMSDATHIRVLDADKGAWRTLRIAGISGIKCYSTVEPIFEEVFQETLGDQGLKYLNVGEENSIELINFPFGVPVKNSSFYYRVIRGICRMSAGENNKVFRYHKLDGTTRDVHTDRETTEFNNNYIRVWDIEKHGWRTLIKDRIEETNIIQPNFSQIISA